MADESKYLGGGKDKKYPDSNLCPESSKKISKERLDGDKTAFTDSANSHAFFKVLYCE